MKGGYSDSWILYSGFSISLFRVLRFKPDAEIGPFGTFELVSKYFIDMGCPLRIKTPIPKILEISDWVYFQT